MKAFFLRRYSLLLLGFILNSCVENLDFDQGEYNASPVLNSPIVFFNLDQNDFIDTTTNTDILCLTEVSNFTYFAGPFFRDNVERVELSIEVNNQFNRSFTFTMDFLDDNDQVVYSIASFTAPPNQMVTPSITPIIISDNQNFLNTRKIRIIVKMSASTVPLNPNIIQNVSFKSAGTYYVRT